ncbi:T9SS type A sorting domain-containing protein [Flavobacterium sp. NRK1]|uniref:T9SS type A sorting domain-containing protein n=1 Tax=Flavobacterium sp. NRK1 TaxID=2954929 RepID=UPI0020932CA5|nr:T9SS type A sorting domain-containing protein [Flavobacterium sp. NRK1]MCO6148528.1 T9SS type A sorting domain-containing protein [Flavobacterium sp. NRK1]
MKGKLLLGMLLASLGLSAQTTHHIDWFMGVSNTAASMTIDQGDTVMWTWTDNLPHTVSSTTGTETFDSGTLTGNGQTFSHVFDNVGETNYKCNIHAMMQGAITVDAVAGIKDNQAIIFEYFPNPVTDILTINAKDTIDHIEIYDVNGKEVMNSESGNRTSKIYMSNYRAGTYFVKVFTGNESKSITIVKN